MRLCGYILALGCLAIAMPAAAQQTYPTGAAGVRVPGMVPLQCDAAAAACAPARGDTNGTVVQPALSSSYWLYTSGAAGILSNTTAAVTVKAAAGAAVRNYVSACQLTTTAFGAAVPIVLRDGASGTVIWTVQVPAAGLLQPVTVNFTPPLRGTGNTLVEVATPTANTTGTVTISCQGYTGS